MERCILVKKGIVKRKGKPSIEFYKNGKPQYYCMGYENRMTDEPYRECRECKKWVLGEQCEKDFEENVKGAQANESQKYDPVSIGVPAGDRHRFYCDKPK